jgi:diacylglycerol kinase family enzyme
MGILPLGTFNYFARSLELPLDDLDAAVEVICSGREVPLRIAMVNDRVFLNNASLGVYPRILATREDVYGRWGRSQVAAYWSVLKTLLSLRRPLELWIQADGAERRLRTPLLFVVNNAYQLDSIGIAGADKIADGHLVALIAPDTGRLGMIRHALSLALGGAVPGTTYEMISASDLKVSVTGATRRLRSVARDGERDTMAAPFHMRVVEEALTVMVPKDWHAETR